MNSQRLILVLAALGVAGACIGGWCLFAQGDPEDLLTSDDADKQAQGMAALANQAGTTQGLERIAQTVRHKNTKVACRGLRALAASVEPNKQLPPEAVRIAESATRDPRPTVKVAAIQALEATTPPLPEDPTVPRIVLDTFVTAKTSETRAAAANALAKFQYWDAMEALLDAMENESPAVRGSAGMAVRQILGVDYGFRANDSPSKRQAVVARLRRDWKAQLPYHLDYVKRVREKRKAQQ